MGVEEPLVVDIGPVVLGGVVPARITLGDLLENVLKRCGWGPPPYNSNRYMVLVCLRICPLQDNRIYLGRWRNLPLNPPATSRSTRAYTLFKEMHELILHPHKRTFPKNAWILQKNWSLIDQYAPINRDTGRDQL